MRTLFSSFLVILVSSCSAKIDPFLFFEPEVPKEVIEQCEKENPDNKSFCNFKKCLTNPIIIRGMVKINEVVSEALEKNKIRWVMGFGTLIGALRFNAPLTYDEDIDLEVIKSEFEAKKTDVEKFLNVRNFEFVRVNDGTIPYFPGSSAAYRVYFNKASFFDLIAEFSKDTGIQISPNDRDYLWKKYDSGEQLPQLDILLHDLSSDNQMSYASTLVRKQCSPFSIDTFFPAKYISFVDQEYPAPNKIEEYMKKCFGTSEIEFDIIINSNHRFECENGVRFRDIRNWPKDTREKFFRYHEDYLRFVLPNRYTGLPQKILDSFK